MFSTNRPSSKDRELIANDGSRSYGLANTEECGHLSPLC